jgi:5-methylcytosine-specific restriction endonuclease McrA
MKKIEIQGKRNQDKMKQMEEPDAVIERNMPKNRLVLPDSFYETDQTLGLDVLKAHIANISIGTILGQGKSTDMVGCVANTDVVLSYILREIDTKRKAYIYQDKHHEIYDSRYSITTERIVELLVSSELLCYYCREICQVTYKESMCRRQWTLDRIDNNYGHNDTNVVIACLNCNLKRGTMDSERFRRGKQFTFRKIE